MVPTLVKKGYMGRAYIQEDPSDATSIIVDDELIGIVALRADDANGILRVLEFMRESATELLTAIEQAQNE